MKRKSDKEVVEDFLVGGVLDLKKLIDRKDYELAKEVLSKYPITLEEKLLSDYKSKKWGSLLKELMDLDLSDASYSLACKKSSLWSFSKALRDSFKHKMIAEWPNTSFLSNHSLSQKGKPKIVEFVLEEIGSSNSKDALVKGLTKDYFLDLLAKKEYELLTIKLCVRIEAILKYDYKYEGTFQEMLDRYSRELGTTTYDDGWGYLVSKETDASIFFNKLRKIRNGMVHAEKIDVKMSDDEYKKAIDCVLKLG